MKREKFTFYGSWWDAVGCLSGELRGEVLTAIIEYGLYGETNSARGGTTKAILELVKPQIDKDRGLYENGCLGGRPKNQSETKAKPDENQTETKQEPIGNQSETKEKPKQNQSETKPEPNETKAEPTSTRARNNPTRDLSLDINIIQENNIPGVKEKRGAGGKGKTPVRISDLEFPYSSGKFMETWQLLLSQQKWKKKSVSALQLSLNKLAKYPEEFAIILMENAISGNYQGIEFINTPDLFERWKASRSGVPRTESVSDSIDKAQEGALRILRERSKNQ